MSSNGRKTTRMLNTGTMKGIDMDFPLFSQFPKMARLSREIVITEKIDGTNAQVLITDDGDWSHRLTHPRRHCAKLYRVELAPLDAASAPAQREPGVLRVEAPPRSLLMEGLRHVAAVLIKESGF